MSHLRVGLVTTIPHGGTVEHALMLAKGLHDLGIEVDAVCDSQSLAERFAEVSAHAHVLPIRRVLDPAGAARVRGALSHVDVVHTHDRRASLWSQLLPRPNRAAALIETVHGIAHPYLPAPIGDAAPGIRDRIAYRLVQPTLARRADAHIVPSRAIRDDLVNRLGYRARDMHVIPNGVDAKTIRFAFATKPVIGTVSRLDPFKGLDVFLRAACEVLKSRPDAEIRIYGTGTEAAGLQLLAKELRIGHRVIFAGHAPAAEAFATLGIFVMSSYWENAPIALLEAMAAGVPVVATTAWGIPEIAAPGTAQLVEPGDVVGMAAAICRLMDSEVLAERQARAARAHVERTFPSEATASAVATLYERVLSKRNRRPRPGISTGD